MSSPVVTGYYRFTDIWFEWPSALPNPDDKLALKAVLAHDALVHPDHPFHVEGINGVQMYIGTFHNGEARLLFSSIQVDYIRYWLHAMKLTETPLPLPYSDCLLTLDDLRNVASVVYENGGDLRRAIKVIDKNNKRLKKSSNLGSRRETFERVQTFWRERKGVWCSMDFEAWELDHTLLTEFGWSLTGWKDGNEVSESHHWIVDEHRPYTNTRHVPDHRNNYNFGKSEIIKKKFFGNRIRNLISGLSRYGPVFLAFHDKSQDIKYLKSSGIDAPLEGLSYILPAKMPTNGLFVVDTADLIGALLGEGPGDRKSMEKMCRLLQINTRFLHNAGNDAHYTLLALKAMAGADPIDIQREKRWPDSTGPHGLKVELPEEDEEGNRSDIEGLIPPAIL